MAVFSGRTRVAAVIIAVGLVLLLVGVAVGAAGVAVILGAANDGRRLGNKPDDEH